MENPEASPEIAMAIEAVEKESENSEIIDNSIGLEGKSGAGESVELVGSSATSIINEEQRLNVSHRAKAFIMNTESSDWEFLAVGICSPEPSEDGEVFAIRLRAEEDTSIILFTAYFHKGQEIAIPNDTVLTWTTMDNDEAALSFESPAGCEEFWRLLCRFYGKSFEEWKLKQLQKQQQQQSLEEEAHEESVEDGEEEYEEDEDEEMIMMRNSRFYEEASDEHKIEISFPEKPELSNLSEIEEGLQQSYGIPTLKRQISEILLQYRYIPSLLEVFEQCEQFGLAEDLAKLFHIFKILFAFNGQEMLRELMSEDNYLRVAGVMEYDPALGTADESKLNIFRSALMDANKFKQVIPMKDENVLQLIHQTFRLQYFKDVILAKILDEESSAAFILQIRLNHMAIINILDNDPEVLEVMRGLLQNVNMALEEQVNVLKFFKEFLAIAKTVTLRKSLQIHQTGVVHDFMKFITRVLNLVSSEGDVELVKEAKLLAIGLFTNFIQHDSSQIRSYLIQSDLRSDSLIGGSGKNLLSIVIDLFIDPETCSSIRWQLVSALKILLDTFNPATGGVAAGGLFQSPQQLFDSQALNQALTQKSGEDFLNYFYPDYACRLLRPLIDFDKTAFKHSDSTESVYFFKDSLSSAQCEIIFHLGELLCSFIAQHKYRIKYLVLRNLILQNSMLLFKCREKHLQLTGLRVLRATLAVEDEFYYRFFIQHRSFGALFAFYQVSGGESCDNLVTSAILDIFEFIRIPRDSLKALVRHLCSIYRTELEAFGPASVFRGILETEDRLDRESSIVSFASSSQTSLLAGSDQEMSPKQPQFIMDTDMEKDNGEREEDYFSNIEEEEDNNEEPSEDLRENENEEEKEDPLDSLPVKKSSDEEEEDHFAHLLSKSVGSPTKKSRI